MACDQNIDNYPTSNRDDFIEIDASGENIGQAFTMGGTTRKICKAQFYLNFEDITASEYYTIHIKIYSATGTVGTDAVSNTELGSSDDITITHGDTGWDSWTLYNFTFSTPVTLSASTDYTILCRINVDGTADDSKDMKVGTDSSLPSHAGNLTYYYGSGTGGLKFDAGIDCIFYMYYNDGWDGQILGLIEPANVSGTDRINIKEINGLL